MVEWNVNIRNLAIAKKLKIVFKKQNREVEVQGSARIFISPSFIRQITDVFKTWNTSISQCYHILEDI